MATKADYVRAQSARPHGGHHCHWPGCNRDVPPAKWGCTKHWYALPAELRRKIWRSFQPGQEISKRPSAEYLRVAREVQDWIAANHPDAGDAHMPELFPLLLKGMRYGEAVIQMKATGCGLRRPHWCAPMLAWVDGCIMFDNEGDLSAWEPTDDDRTASDWEMVDRPAGIT